MSFTHKNVYEPSALVPKPAGFATLTVSGTALPLVGVGGAYTSLNPATNEPQTVQSVMVQVLGANVVYRGDGTAPTASVGIVLSAGAVYLLSFQEFLNGQVIAQSGTATLSCQTNQSGQNI